MSSSLLTLAAIHTCCVNVINQLAATKRLIPIDFVPLIFFRKKKMVLVGTGLDLRSSVDENISDGPVACTLVKIRAAPMVTHTRPAGVCAWWNPSRRSPYTRLGGRTYRPGLFCFSCHDIWFLSISRPLALHYDFSLTYEPYHRLTFSYLLLAHMPMHWYISIINMNYYIMRLKLFSASLLRDDMHMRSPIEKKSKTFLSISMLLLFKKKNDPCTFASRVKLRGSYLSRTAHCSTICTIQVRCSSFCTCKQACMRHSFLTQHEVCYFLY